MDKKPFVIIIVILLAMPIIAISQIFPGIPIIDREISLDNEVKDELESVGIESWSYKDYIGTDVMWRCIETVSDYDIPCSDRYETYWMNTTWDGYEQIKVRVEYTVKEKDAILDAWEQQQMEITANAIKTRREAVEINITKEGNVTILKEIKI